MLKTRNCGDLRAGDVGRTVVLAGWVYRRRDHGGLIFIDLRDRAGVVQVTGNPERSAEVAEALGRVRLEYVLRVWGTVQRRPAGLENPRMATGEIEVVAERVELLNAAKATPFPIEGDGRDIAETLRFKHRYLDLRRERMRDNLLLRGRFTKFIRDYLVARDFVEVETPILFKSTPEGAREYLVPSRMHAGMFYALPQSPQQFKQLLMVAGIERYFQIARCFRDEDQRGHRQPEFTQLDIEVSFVEREDILNLVEGLLTEFVGKHLPARRLLTSPFQRLAYDEVMDRYGTDKPDLRFGMELRDATDLAAASGFGVFRQAAEAGGRVKGIVAPGCGGYTRKQLDELTAMAKAGGAQGLVTLAIEAGGTLRGPAAKFLSPAASAALCARLGAAEGDLMLLVAGEWEMAATVLGELRLELGTRLKLADPDVLAFAWVLDFPLFKWEEGRWNPSHHMFTAPRPEDLPLLESAPGKVKSQQYDLVCNGYEVAGGSIRIHQRPLQEQIFALIGIEPEEALRKFGYMMEAFEYGTPPHGGIAPGVDRLVALFAGEPSIREVIAFPKTQQATDLMAGCPSPVLEKQLQDLHIRLASPQEETQPAEGERASGNPQNCTGAGGQQR
jgi:aspartyl-tRNA synthetase